MAQTEGAQDLESGVLASHWLGPESEELTLKSGLLAIRGALGDRGLLDFPRRPNGTPLVVRQGFFERLLKGEATLQNVAAADASAAEPDVKKLGLQQLLAIRCQSLDYHPTGKDLDPKRSFLVLVDQCIMPLLGQRLLGEETKAFSEAHRAIVMRQVVLIYGANSYPFFRHLAVAGAPRRGARELDRGPPGHRAADLEDRAAHSRQARRRQAEQPSDRRWVFPGRSRASWR
ncbi:unnamed protein product [Prorocentrum cordatum]|uniref:Uncharacterized protein n=1 Tax=Prorocentrum cordatum TaxID=2364126 RepID=A0ABN9SFQ5_9DINO|nr:unnamed protein product [Polarella glacialis]